VATGIHLYQSIHHQCSFILVILKLHTPTYPRSTSLFCFLSVGNPKTFLKGDYLGWLCKLFDKALD
jgi:hypothetical protein